MRWRPIAAGLALCALAATAQAAVSLMAPPRGFVQPPAAAAEARASTWAAAVDGRPTHVFSTEDADGYYETIAVIEVEGALLDDVATDPEHTLLEAFGEALGQTAPPVDAAVELDASGKPGPVRGRFEAGGETWFVAIASSGPTHALVIMAVQTDEASLYAHGFDGIVAQLQGTAPPASAFSIARWRIAAASCWLMFGALTWILLARIRSDDDIAERAKKVGGTCAVAAVLVFVVAWLALDRSAEALALAGLSRGWVAAEAALAGIAAAVVALIVGAIGNREVRPIESAPTEGAFRRFHPAPIRPTTQPHAIVPAPVEQPTTHAGPVETTVRSYPPPPPKR